VAYFQHDYPTARMFSEESLAIMRELQHGSGIADSLCNLGNVACEQGDYQTARTTFEEALAIRHARGDQRGTASSLEGLAAVVAALGRSLKAARIWGAAERLRTEVGAPLSPNDRTDYERRVAEARAVLGDDAAFDRAWREGCVLTLEQAMELALEETIERP
jgi:tetratricopeptide (TPR) repeat protein